MSDPEPVRGLQERTARALPAARIACLDGWWLRHAPGCAWWVSTVLPHGGAGPDELAYRVVEAEKWYAGHGTSARFQISPGACPQRLDALLAGRGYRRDGVMSLRVAPTARVLARAPAGALPVRIDERPTRGWFEAWLGVHGNGVDPASEWDLLGRVRQRSGYARVRVDGEVVAVGRAVADTGWAGVFGMATAPAARGQGAAGAVLAALAGWAAGQAAGKMYLQVERDNAPAVRLYERAGFTETCGYHYRTAG